MHADETIEAPADDLVVLASPGRPAVRIQTAAASKTVLASASAVAAALLAACGGGGGANNSGSGATSVVAGSDSEPKAQAGFNNYSKAQSDEEAARFLMQSQFAVTDAGLSAVRSATFATQLQQDFASPQGQTGWDWLEQRGYGAADINRYFFAEYPADFMVWHQLFTAPDPMRKRMALALSEFFVVSLQSAEFTWRSHAMAHYWDTLVSLAFGNYRQLLEAITLNPAMGYFLNTRGNQKENSAGRVPDENYGREVMQLFTIGLVQLNADGTEKLGANGAGMESYTQDDVTNIARVFTGYDFDTTDGVRITPVSDTGVPETYTIESRDFARKPMKFDATRHSMLAATFLGTTIPANTAGPAALKTALDTLFNHPNTAPFFARQMIQRLVTSHPSPAYVGRVSAAFANNGAGVRGDLKAVWTAILLDDEARNPAKALEPGYGKLREPMLRLVQWGRSFGVGSAAGSWKMFDTNSAADKLGQSPLRSPSVFNFFRPGFVPPNTALARAQAPAPEFQLVNETTVAGYINYMQGVIRDGIRCPEPTVPQAAYNNYIIDITARYTSELALVAGDATALVRRLNLILCAGQMLGTNQNLIIAALNGTPVTASSTAAQKLDRVAAGVLLVMASADYLVQR